MLSPDPVTQAPENGQSYDRYTYAFNNPLKFIDPTGYSNELGEGNTGLFPDSQLIQHTYSWDDFHLDHSDPALVLYWAIRNGFKGTNSSAYELIQESQGITVSNAAADGCTGNLSLGGICDGYDIPNYLEAPESERGDLNSSDGDIQYLPHDHPDSIYSVEAGAYVQAEGDDTGYWARPVGDHNYGYKLPDGSTIKVDFKVGAYEVSSNPNFNNSFVVFNVPAINSYGPGGLVAYGHWEQFKTDGSGLDYDTKNFRVYSVSHGTLYNAILNHVNGYD